MNNSLGAHVSRKETRRVGYDITRSLRIPHQEPGDIYAAHPSYVITASRRPVEI